MYDVFNNALTHGGKLNITFDRHFIVPEGTTGYFTESILRRRTKYANRNTMKDVTLRLGLVASYHIIQYEAIFLKLRFFFIF